MKSYILKWHKLGKVEDIYPILRGRVYLSDKLFPHLRKSGIYLFLDDQKGVVDVGEANPKGRALRNRIINEIYENSAFFRKLEKWGMDRPSQREFIVKIAAVEQGIDYANASPEEIDAHLRLIESALICQTDPWSNSHGGIDEWRKEEVDIVNLGDYNPLPPKIVIMRGQKCPRIWIRIPDGRPIGYLQSE
jgi:hypothetical protein